MNNTTILTTRRKLLKGCSHTDPGRQWLDRTGHQFCVTPTFGAIGGVGFTSNLATIDFASPEFAEFQFGNPFCLPGTTDWMLSAANLRAGDAFSITACRRAR